MSEVIYDKIGEDYNETRQADPFLLGQLIKLLKPAKEGLYLDIGCGTGNYTIAFADKGFNFYGVEPSEEMLTKAKCSNRDITWLPGTAENIPVSKNLFDGAIATLTLHHWKDMNQAFGELFRVLKTAGKLVIFTSTPQQMKGYWLNHYFPKMMARSIKQMPGLEFIISSLKINNFAVTEVDKYFIQDDLKDNFLYAGKEKPGLYFNQNIRNGISSFASLANSQEVKQGVSKLAADITSGKFEEIKLDYRNSFGDYLFISAEKQDCS